uniref:Uncharacterized protein n=1 Tax=Glossina pallidipes TaxID=7398 RepID=A0A1B0A4J6_GLOPL
MNGWLAHGTTQSNQSTSVMTHALLDCIEALRLVFIENSNLSILLFFGMARLLRLSSIALRTKAMKYCNGPSYPFKFKKKGQEFINRNRNQQKVSNNNNNMCVNISVKQVKDRKFHCHQDKEIPF